MPFLTDPRPQPVVLVHPGDDTDSRGHPADVWTVPPAVETVLHGATTQRSSSIESTSDGSSRVVTTLTLFVPGTRQTLTARDRVRVGDLTYRIDGEPQAHNGLTLAGAYTTARLVRVVG
jgi:hypothetical protein